MRRPILITLIGLGAIIPVAGAGVFAASSDTVSSAGNFIQTGEFSVDLAIRIGSSPGALSTCNGTDGETFSHLQKAGVITGGALQPEQGLVAYGICVQNRGRVDADLSAAVTNVVSTDVTCPANESFVETGGLRGATCSPEGELGAITTVDVRTHNCATGDSIGSVNQAFDGLNVDLGRLGANAAKCFSIVYRLPDEIPVDAQTDRLEWDLTFTGTAA